MTISNSGMTLYQNMDSDTNWVGEDGISTEEFQQGVASQQWVVAKSGNETATLTLAADMTGAKYLMIPMISTISPFYTSISATLNDGTNTDAFTMADQLGGLLHRAVAGQWKFNNHMLQFSGSLVLANFSSIDINVDNSASGNIRSVLNHYIDAIYYGTGRTISGSTVGDKLFKESNELNVSADVFDGCTLEYGGAIFAQSDIDIATTLGNSFGETLIFNEVPNTDNIYTLKVTNTSDFRASSIQSATANVTTNVDMSAAIGFQKLGGSIVGAGTTAFKLGQDVKGVVFTDRTSIAQNGSNFEDNTINNSGAITVLSTGTFANNTINKSTAPLIASSLNDLDVNRFISSGTGYAINLGAIASDITMSWNNNDSGYTADSLGNETILVSVEAGFTLTISVAGGATTPTINNIGAGTVDVQSGLITVAANGCIIGKAIYIERTDTGEVLIDEIAAASVVSVPFSYPDIDVPILIRHRVSSPDDTVIKKRYTNTDFIRATGVNHTINLTDDTLSS